MVLTFIKLCRIYYTISTDTKFSRKYLKIRIRLGIICSLETKYLIKYKNNRISNKLTKAKQSPKSNQEQLFLFSHGSYILFSIYIVTIQIQYFEVLLKVDTCHSSVDQLKLYFKNQKYINDNSISNYC